MSHDRETVRKLEDTSEAFGFRFSMKEIENETPSIITQLIKSSKAGVCLLDPMLITPPSEIASGSPDLLFIAFGRGEGAIETQTNNLIVGLFDHEKTLFSAGKIAGTLITDRTISMSLAGKENISPLFGVLHYPLPSDSETEIPSLKSGFLSVAEESSYKSVALKNLDNADEANLSITKMFGAGVRIFYIHAYSLDTNCLETLRRLGGYAIVDDWNPSSGYTDVVIFGISEDLSRMLGKALTFYKSRGINTRTPNEQSITLETQIVWGKIIPIPDKVKAMM